MFTLLIVDDEEPTVDLLVSSLAWDKLRVGRVLTAGSAAEARGILSSTPVDILLTDVEMPGESGLQLLHWVKEEQLPVQCVVISGHANFEYAKQAIDLNSVSYVLKPVSFEQMEEMILQVGDSILETRRKEQLAQQGENWISSYDSLLQLFWQNLLLGCIGQTRAAVDEAMVASGLSLPHEGPWRAVVLSGTQDRVKEGPRGGWGIKPEVLALVSHYTAGAACMPFAMQGKVVLALHSGQAPAKLAPAMLEALSQAGYHAALFVSQPGALEEMRTRYEAILRVAWEYPVYSGLYVEGETTLAAAPYTPPEDLAIWLTLLLKGFTQKVAAGAKQYMGNQARAGTLSRTCLEQFFYDFMQVVYAVLTEKGIPAGSVFPFQQGFALPDPSRGLADMYDWVDFILAHMSTHIEAKQDALPVAERVKAYIHKNILKNISRGDIAEHVHLNPEYLSRIFRQSTGISLGDYITQEKMETAKALLTGTNLPVSEIAAMLDYNNFAYFSQVFRKYTGQRPLAFRGQPEGEDASCPAPP